MFYTLLKPSTYDFLLNIELGNNVINLHSKSKKNTFMDFKLGDIYL